MISGRQQGPELNRDGARPDASGSIDQARARQPSLEFRRRTAAEQVAHGERIVE
jgi:hypothetical protein